MTPEHSIEIARQEGPDFRSVRLGIEPGGAILMDAQDMGPAVKRVWDTEDYEFWVRIEPATLPKLAFELLKDKFAGRTDAVDVLRDYCKAHDIAHEFGSWV
jgi:hypothetical protein